MNYNKQDGKSIFDKEVTSKQTEEKPKTNGTSILLSYVANILTTEKNNTNKIKKLLEVLK